MSVLPTVIIETPAGDVVINESDFDPATMTKVVPPLPPLPGAPLEPKMPGAPDALSDLPTDWRDKSAAELKALAFAISGRTVDNKAQAVEVIDQALKGRG